MFPEYVIIVHTHSSVSVWTEIGTQIFLHCTAGKSLISRYCIEENDNIRHSFPDLHFLYVAIFTFRTHSETG